MDARFNDYFEFFDGRISMKIGPIVNTGTDPFMPGASLPEIVDWLSEEVVYSEDIRMNTASSLGYHSSHQASNSSFDIDGKKGDKV